MKNSCGTVKAHTDVDGIRNLNSSIGLKQSNLNEILLIILTTFDFCFISLEYLCGMWNTTDFWRSGPDNTLLREKSFRLCCGVTVGRHSEILFRIAYY